MRKNKINKKQKFNKIVQEKLNSTDFKKKIEEDVQRAENFKAEKNIQRTQLEVKSFGKFDVQKLLDQILKNQKQSFKITAPRNSIPKFIKLIEQLKKQKVAQIQIFLEDPPLPSMYALINQFVKIEIIQFIKIVQFKQFVIMEFVESDLKFLLIFRNKNIQIEEEDQSPLEGYDTVYYYKNVWPNECSKQWDNEMNLILLKYREMKIRVKERASIYSQFQDYSWYITKDEYGNYYLFLANTQFQEKYVYKLQYKVKSFLEKFAEQINEGKINEPVDVEKVQGIFKQTDTLKKVIKVRIDSLILSYNNAIYKKLGVSSLQNIRIDDKATIQDVNLQRSALLVQSEDADNYFQKTQKRQSRLLCIQFLMILAIFASIVFGIMLHLQPDVE